MRLESAIYRVRKGLRNRRNQVIIALAVAFLVADAAGAYYIGWYTSGSIDASFSSLDSEVIDILGPVSSPFIWTEDKVLRLDGDVPNIYHNGPVLDMEVGDTTGATALLFPDGNLTYNHANKGIRFTVEVGLNASIIGIGENWTPEEYKPDYVMVALPDNATTVVQALSINDDGEVAWQTTIDGNMTMHSRTSNSRFISVLSDIGELSVWTKSDPIPIYTYQVDEAMEMVMAPNYALVALTTTNEVVILQNDQEQRVEFPGNVYNLMVRYDRDHVYVQDDDAVYDVHDGIYDSIKGLSEGEWYVAPTVADRLFIVNGDYLNAYHGIRETILWTCDLGGEPDGIRADIIGMELLAWNGESLILIDNENPPMGNSDLWLYFGILILAETIIVVGLGCSDNLRHIRPISPVVIAVGTLICMSVAYLFPNQATVDWYGSIESYIIVAGGIGLISMTIGWYSEAGIGSFFYGFVTGLIASIPVAIVATYLLTAMGYTFPGDNEMLYSLFHTMKTGIIIGLTAGIVAYVASLIDDL